MDVLVALAPDADIDAETADRLARRLRAEIAELDVDSARFAGSGAVPPDGSKAADPVTLGAIVVAMSASGGVFVALVDTLRDWLGRQNGRHKLSVTIDGDTIELDAATVGQQRDLVAAYLERHRVE